MHGDVIREHVKWRGTGSISELLLIYGELLFELVIYYLTLNVQRISGFYVIKMVGFYIGLFHDTNLLLFFLVYYAMCPGHKNINPTKIKSISDIKCCSLPPSKYPRFIKENFYWLIVIINV